LVDSHCHLADAVFAADLEQVVARARTAGVERALVILAAGERREAEQAQRARELWPDVRLAVGVHPHQAHDFDGREEECAEVVRRQVAETPAVRAIGEIGLDYYYDLSPRNLQRRIFRDQVRLACELQLPVVIHTREADEDTLQILREEGGRDLRGVLHCFTGGPSLASAGMDLGLCVSIAGIITFKNAAALRETVRGLPLDRLLTETDSPFLAPVPFRGRRNEPAHVTHVVDALAQVHGTSPALVAARSTALFETLFRP
jgi:TatD DNase family protein